jgi:hypothetical protein
MERDPPFPEPSFTYLSESPVKETPTSIQVPLAELPERERHSISRAFFYPTLNIPSKEASP